MTETLKMTSRERVLASIEHREPDGLPVDMGATPSSGISTIAYYNLKKYLGLGGPTRVYDVVQQLAQPEESGGRLPCRRPGRDRQPNRPL